MGPEEEAGTYCRITCLSREFLKYPGEINVMYIFSFLLYLVLGTIPQFKQQIFENINGYQTNMTPFYLIDLLLHTRP